MKIYNTKNYYPTKNPLKGHESNMFNGQILFDYLFSNFSIEVFCEVGCYYGSGVRYLLDYNKDVFICAIDLWDNEFLINLYEKLSFDTSTYETELRNYPLFDAFISNIWNDKHRVLPLKMNSIDGLNAIKKLKINPDVIYIDSSHTYEDTKEELNESCKLFPDSILCGDDYDPNYGGVAPAVNEFTETHNFDLKIFKNQWLLLQREK